MVERIEALCREKGLSFRKVEMSLGFSNGILRSWEKKTPTADKLAAVAAFFNVSMEYLLTGKEKAPAHEEPELSEDEVMLLSAFRSLTEDQKRLVLQWLSAAAQDPGDQGAV